MNETARILRIEKISPNDGAGLRTVVFFKGCPMRCRWCSTPESQKMAPELRYQAAGCAACGECAKRCSRKALSLNRSTGRIVLDKVRCDNCFDCVAACPSGALGVYGREMTVSQVMKHIARDEIFYYHSGGGVTLSGGDVLAQPEFAMALLMACKDAGLHTAAELNMFGDFEKISGLLPYLDEIYADVKLMDGALHRQWTGVDNAGILQNILKAASFCRPGAVHIRTPLIRQVNDSPENIAATANFCTNLASCGELEFLPYHRLGQAAHEHIWRDYPLKDLPAMTSAETRDKVSFLKDKRLPFPIRVSGETVSN